MAERNARAPYLTWPKGKDCWQIRSGGQYKSTGTKDRREADLRLSEFIIAQASAPMKRSKNLKATLAEALDIYDAERQKKNPTTWRKKWQYVSAIVRRHGGKFYLSALTLQWGEWYETERRFEGVGDATIRQEMQLILSAFRLARSSTHRLTDLPDPEFDLPPASEPRDCWINRAEADRLIDACELEHIEIFVRIALATAARHEAILELRWRDVDLERGVIDFRDARRNDEVKVDERGRKTMPRRKPRASCRVEGVLLDRLIDAKGRSASEFVIEFGGKGIGSIKRAFRGAVKSAGLNPSEVTPHTLRHSVITWLMRDGQNVEDVAAFAGHKDSRMILKVYGHHHPDFQKSISGSLARSK
ncbi:tyrosine-type recombinase/integrase [Thioclava sp. 15-R06ZXC-3]|uniref:Tyrosine-type recombinase/integrase n=1 Tax=Thioclava arctica TaxID=3238301 RepID=A0ABV3TKQ5_9RHOB